MAVLLGERKKMITQREPIVYSTRKIEVEVEVGVSAARHNVGTSRRRYQKRERQTPRRGVTAAGPWDKTCDGPAGGRPQGRRGSDGASLLPFGQGPSLVQIHRACRLRGRAVFADGRFRRAWRKVRDVVSSGCGDGVGARTSYGQRHRGAGGRAGGAGRGDGR